MSRTALARTARAARRCGRTRAIAPCLGRDWYRACLDSIDSLERSAERGDLDAALASFRDFCEAAADVLNREPGVPVRAESGRRGGTDGVGA